MNEWLRRWFFRLVIVVAAAFILTFGLVLYEGLSDSNRMTDCAVVLGDPLGADGKPQDETSKRLDYVAGLLRTGGLKTVILTAQAPSMEAKAIEDGMNQYLATKGAPAGSIMEDLNGSTSETMAADVAAYLKSAGMTSVLLAANYADIARNKLALYRAGVATVMTWHSGSTNWHDLPTLAGTVIVLWRNVFEKDVEPDAQKFITLAKTKTQSLLDSTKKDGSDTMKAQAAKLDGGTPATSTNEAIPVAGAAATR